MLLVKNTQPSVTPSLYTAIFIERFTRPALAEEKLSYDVASDHNMPRKRLRDHLVSVCSVFKKLPGDISKGSRWPSLAFQPHIHSGSLIYLPGLITDGRCPGDSPNFRRRAPSLPWTACRVWHLPKITTIHRPRAMILKFPITNSRMTYTNSYESIS